MFWFRMHAVVAAAPRHAAVPRKRYSWLPSAYLRTAIAFCWKTMETGTITEWLVKEGDAFAAGDIICMVETDKVSSIPRPKP